MQRLQLLNSIRKQKSTIGVFMGVNRTETKQDTEFRDMQNLSSDEYPTMTPRAPRGDVLKTFTKCNGIFYKNALAYVDGTSFYYNGEEKGTVSDSPKTMIGMGAYIVIMPDKVVFNTADGSWKNIEASWTQAATATIEPTYDASTYTKISCDGIGELFEEGDAVTISGCIADVINGSKIIQSKGDDYIVVIAQLTADDIPEDDNTSSGSDTGSSGEGETTEETEISITQESGITITRTMPDMDFICEADNRLWGCSSANHEIYASKLGDPTNWNCFEGTSMDSYAATVGSDGDFTGCISYMGYVLFFKEDHIHKLYGSKPSNIQIMTYPYRGVAKGCSESLCVVNETLYYAGRNEILRYDGALPESASDALGVLDIKTAAADTYHGKYYVTIKNRQEASTLYVYDPKYGTWHKEDNTYFDGSTVGDGELYYLQGQELRIIADDNGSERVTWYADSGAQYEGSMDKKRISMLQLMVEMEKDTLFEVFVTYNDGKTWERAYSKLADKRCSESVNIVPRKCDYFRYKVQGAGWFKLYALAKTVRITGRR